MSAKKSNFPKKVKGLVQAGPILTEENKIADEQRLAACKCNRGKTTIHCTRCGMLFFGRVHLECTVHKNVVFLYDLRQCASCKCSWKNLEELNIDFETYKKLIRVANPDIKYK